MKTMKRILCSIPALAIVLGMAAASAAESGTISAARPVSLSASQPATVADKDEVVYARLSGDGSARNIYVVNHFTLQSGGKITDHGDYTSVVNLTDLQPISLDSGEVTVLAPGESFYYQGNLAGTNLPWLYNIEYRLNGAPTPPESLGGKSGNLEIRMASTRNDAVNAIFFNNYMQQITITLNSENCANIRADGATSANAGKNRMLVYTVLPGQNADITISADVADFAMAGIEITAMPFSMSFDIPEMDGMLDEFTLLADAISELDDGVGKLNDGASLMASGSVELRDGSSEFMSGLSQLNANAGQLTSASAQINDALSLIGSSLDSADISSDMITELARLPETLAQLADGLDRVSDGMKEQKDAYSQALAALDKAISDIPGQQFSEAQLHRLYAKADDDEQALLSQLIESSAAAAAVKGTYEQTRQAFASVTTALDSLSRSNISAMLNFISAQIGGALSGNDMMGQLGQLTDGLLELSLNYAEFHGGLRSFMQGLSALGAGYAELDGGIAEFSGGISEMSGGVAELHAGTNLLAAETSNIPELIKHEVENLISEFSSAEFEAVSFTSERNSGVSFVQFVFKAEGIERPAAERVAAADADQLSFWDRVVKLFVK